MAKKILTTIKLQAPGGQASPAPPVGPALGQHGINIMEFVKAFNAQTANDMGTTIPVVITVYEDRSFTFVTKTPPAAVLIRQAIGIDKGSGEPNRTKVGTITNEQVRAIAEKKLGDLNAHDVDQAVKLMKDAKRAKFDESVEIHIRTGLNVRHADEQLRGTIALPHGLGKEVKIAVFARGDKAREAEEAGADFVVAIATPDMMPVVGRLGRILGPQGKMPNPKVGTVTIDVRKAVQESKAGKVEYRTDRTAIVHMILGKTSFEDRQLLENYQAIVEELVRAKPSAAKGKYLRTIVVASTMGPGIKVDPSKTRDLIESNVAEGAAAAALT